MASPLDAAGDRDTASRRVLIVDDNFDSAESLAILLRFLGHEVSVAHDGIEAVDAARSFEPDIILLDIGLPRLNGYDAARRIRLQSAGKAMTLVALTGWGQEEDIKRSLEAGFDVHVVKPVSVADLRRLIANAA